MPEPTPVAPSPGPKPQGGNAAQPPPAPAPPVVGDFEVLDRIGQGGMGAVFKARQRSMDRLVALKILRPSLATDSSYVERFWREARAAARLSHPNIVLAITVGEDHGLYYFVMEYVEGHTVALLLKAGPFEERRALEIALQIARALDYAWTHERIVHRDIKPGNIILTRDGVAKLADLGLAHIVNLEDDEALAPDEKIVGTPHYIAPEQIQRRPDLDVRADLYALGATLFHMVTGRPPYDGPTTKAVLAKHMNDPVPDPRQFRPDLSEGAARIIMRLLAKDRDDRYPDARALEADIEAVLRRPTQGPRHLPPRARAVHPRQQGLSPAVTFSFALLVVLLIVVAVAIGNLIAQGGGGRREPGVRRHAPPLPPPADPRLGAAERAYREAEAFAKAHGADPLAAIARLREVETQFAGISYAQWAADLRAQIEADLEKKNAETLRGIESRAETLIGEKRFAEALGMLAKPPPLLAIESWRERVAKARDRIERQARRAFDALLAGGDDLAAKGDFDEAVHAYESAGAAAPEAWRIEAARRSAAARRKQKEAAERAQAEREAAYLRLLAGAAELYRARKYEAATQFIKGALESAPAAHRDDLRRELAESAQLEDFWARFERGLKGHIGRPFVIRGISGELAAVRDGRVTIKSRGGSFSEEMRKLPADQVLAIALGEYTSLEAPLAAARFLIAEGQLAAAATHLKAAEDAGADTAALRARLRRIEAAAAPGALPKPNDREP